MSIQITAPVDIRTVRLGDVATMYARFNAGRVVDGLLSKERMNDPIGQLAPSLQKRYDVLKSTALLYIPWHTVPDDARALAHESMLQYADELEAEGIREVLASDGGIVATYNCHEARRQFLLSRGFDGPAKAAPKDLSDPKGLLGSGNRRWYAAWPAAIEWAKMSGQSPADYPLVVVVEDWQGWDWLRERQIDENAQEGREAYDEVGMVDCAIPWVKLGWGAGVIQRKLNIPQYGKAQKITGLAKLCRAYPQLRLLHRFAMDRVTEKGPDGRQRVAYSPDGYVDVTPIQWQAVATLLGETKKAQKGKKAEPQDYQDVLEAIPDFTPGNRATPEQVETYIRWKMAGNKAGAGFGRKAMEAFADQVKGTGSVVEGVIDAYLTGDRAKMASAIEAETSVTLARVEGMAMQLLTPDKITLRDRLSEAIAKAEAEQPEAEAEQPEAEEPKAEEPTADPTTDGGKDKKGTRSRRSHATS